METYISMLRGINVSGHKMVKMDELQQLYKNLGFANVQTYIQSGNVIFQSKKIESAELEKKIAKKIKEVFSFEISVLVKSADEFKRVLKNNSFVTKRNEDGTKLHVTFLSNKPKKMDVDEIYNGEYASDEFIITDGVVYLFCPNGYGNTKLTTNFFEKKLNVVATTRNWKTMNKLVELAGAPE